MEIANSMKGITENIISSYNTRVEALDGLVFDTHKTLKGFASDRKKTAREQARCLANFAKDLSKSVEDMLKRFQESQKQMSEGQAKGLTYFIKNLINDVGSMLNGFRKDRGKMSKELKNRLAKEVKDIETYIDRRLNEFDEAHTEMTEQQKKDLAKFVSKIKSEVKKLLADCKDDIAGYRNEINRGSRAWKAMAATLAKGRRRSPMPLRVEAGGGRTTVEDAVEKKRVGEREGGDLKENKRGTNLSGSSPKIDHGSIGKSAQQ